MQILARSSGGVWGGGGRRRRRSLMLQLLGRAVHDLAQKGHLVRLGR